MRYALVPACALLLLAGCGRSSTDPPQAASKSGGDDASADGKKGGQAGPEKGSGTDTKKGSRTPENKQGANSGFDRDDPRKTLDWLIHQFAKVRATAPKDQNALEKAWADFASAAKAAEKQKVRWTVPLYAVQAKGVVANWVKSDADPDCDGLRVIPDHQPPDRLVLLLETPEAGKAGQFKSGDPVVITGVVERIEASGPGKTSAHAKTYGFHVRLSDYRVSPKE